MRKVLDDHVFVVEDKLQLEASPEGGRISGEVSCYDNIILDVMKHFTLRTVRGRKQARTTGYSYHARRRHGEDILRYDSAHRYPAHPTPHHKHDFSSGSEIITHVGEDWPHLGEVLDELRDLAWGTP